MIIKPKRRGFICTTAHPEGCAAHIQEQIDSVQKNSSIEGGPKNVLIIGASTGYGLASRVTAAFGCGASTIGVIFERAAEGKRTATAGWYNTVAFEEKAQAQGIYAKTINGDAFSDEIKKQVVDLIKNDLGKIDLLIYSLASPRREHPKTKEISKSILKPIGTTFTSKTLNLATGKLEDITLTEASDEEIRQTISVMGGEDWEYWIDALEGEDLLSQGVMTVAYSYVGPQITRIVYREGTIGQAKEHLESTAHKLDKRLKPKNGRALISVNKALITQSSSAIPVIPLYFVVLNKIMKSKDLDESCIEQVFRLFSSYLYNGSGNIPVDEKGLIRLDDRELNKEVQKEVMAKWEILTDENIGELADIEGFHKGFLNLFGFCFPGVDYDVETEPNKPIPSIK